ncbi:MAG: pantetheine-phosphate adenylyltransferase [bacterium]
MKRIAIYPGSFDPLTHGHLDLIKRSLKIFDKVIVAVTHHPHKKSLFTLEERVSMIKESTRSLKGVKVDGFGGLLVKYAKRQKIHTIIRGLRAVSDFEYELQMVLMNRRLEGSVETIFLMPAEQFSYLSSSLVKEISASGGDVSKFVPHAVGIALKEKFSVDKSR